MIEEEKKNDAIEILKRSNANIGIKRLGQILTLKQFERDIEPSNKYRKIQK